MLFSGSVRCVLVVTGNLSTLRPELFCEAAEIRFVACGLSRVAQAANLWRFGYHLHNDHRQAVQVLAKVDIFGRSWQEIRDSDLHNNHLLILASG